MSRDLQWAESPSGGSCWSPGERSERKVKMKFVCIGSQWNINEKASVKQHQDDEAEKFDEVVNVFLK